MKDKPKQISRANVLGVGISALNLDLATADVMAVHSSLPGSLFRVTCSKYIIQGVSLP